MKTELKFLSKIKWEAPNKNETIDPKRGTIAKLIIPISD